MTRRQQLLRVRAHALTDVGRVREQNEDNHFAGTSAFAVADGMGGHQAGEVASETALEPIRRLDGRRFASSQAAQEALVEAIATANEHVVEMAVAEPAYRGMGTTLTAVVFREGQLHVAHVGDSRAYLLRDGEEMSQLTTDHTLVEQFVQEGRISRDEAAVHPQRSVITRAIGVEREIDIDSLPPIELQTGDQILLCSDGLTGLVVDELIAEIIATTPDGDEACARLVEAANEAGGADNITVVLLRFDGADESDGQPGESTVQIRTRKEQEAGEDWATSIGRFGAPQGAAGRRPEGRPRGRLRRWLTALLAIAVIIGVIVGGGVLLLSRAYFVGSSDDHVAVFRGIPQEVAGVRLYQLEERTDLPVADLGPLRQRRLEEGIPVESPAAARQLVEELREEAAQAEQPS